MNAFDIPVPDGVVHGIDEGEGNAVVMLHGGALNHGSWRHQAAELRASHRVIALDARGHGDSSTPRTPFRHADDVITVLESLDTGPAIVMGLSMGASTAIDVAVERPDLVAALVLVGAGVGAHPEEFQDPFMHSVLADWARAQAEQDPVLWTDAFLRVTVGAGRDASEVDGHALEELRAMVLHTLGHHIDAHAVGPTVTDHAREHLAELGMPVLAVHGAADSPDHHRMAAEVARSVRHGREVTIPDAGHHPTLERPDAFNAAVRAWLEENGLG